MDIYPAVQQMLIHQGKVLKDDTTLEENKVAENSFIVIMLSKVISFSLSCNLIVLFLYCLQNKGRRIEIRQGYVTWFYIKLLYVKAIIYRFFTFPIPLLPLFKVQEKFVPMMVVTAVIYR